MCHMLILKFWRLSCRTPSGCLCRRRWGWSWWWIWSVASFTSSLLLQKSSLKVSFAYLKNYYPLQAAPCGCLYDVIVPPSPPPFQTIIHLKKEKVRENGRNYGKIKTITQESERRWFFLETREKEREDKRSYGELRR